MGIFWSKKEDQQAKEMRELAELQAIQAQQGQHMPNYFDDRQYLDFVKHYSEDDTIPSNIKNKRWSVYGKALTFTFLDEPDIPLVDVFSNILKIDSMVSIPAHRLNFNDIDDFDQTKLYFWLTAKRAIGTIKNKMNERTLQQTQIAQSINMQSMSQQKTAGGMINRLKSMF